VKIDFSCIIFGLNDIAIANTNFHYLQGNKQLNEKPAFIGETNIPI